MPGRWEVRALRSAKGSTLEKVFDLLHPRMVRAIRVAHEAYAGAGVRHALIGGLAVGIHGEPRATQDVDYLVGKEAFETRGTLVSFRAGIPIAVEGVPVDSVLAPEEYAAVLDEALDEAVSFDGVPVVTVEHLVFMKMVAGSRRDRADVEALVRVGDLYVPRARSLLERGPESARTAFEKILGELTGS